MGTNVMELPNQLIACVVFFVIPITIFAILTAGLKLAGGKHE